MISGDVIRAATHRLTVTFAIDDSRIPVIYGDIRTAVEAQGFILRGGFHPTAGDAVPDLSPGIACKTLLIVGNAGPDMWRRFSSSPEFQLDNNPLNAFSQRVIGEFANAFGASAMFPFTGPPFLPFINWAQRAEPVWPSPIGPLIHPEYGLWHAYRGALGFADVMRLPTRAAAARPCDTCAEKPCLHTCPVNAFDGNTYHVPACISHIGVPTGGECIRVACLARRACPVGVEYAYAPDQAEFHMRAFINGRQGR